MTARVANFPTLVLDRAADIAPPRTAQRAVLAAACRAAVASPPRGPVSYPTLTTGVSQVTVPLGDAGLHPAAVAVEADFFYRRFAWLCLYGLCHPDAVLHYLRLARDAPEELAAHDRAAYERLVGGQPPCRIPTTARAPVSTCRR